MKNIYKALLFVQIISLASCGSIKVDESGQEIDNFLSKYSLKVSSDSNNLYFSTNISTEEYMNRGEAGIVKAGYFINSAHYDFNSYQDVLNPEFWYWQNSNEENAEKFPIEDFAYQTEQDTRYYVQQITFGMKIESESDNDEFDISIDSIVFPKVNVFSLIFLGNVGYQERLSNGDEVSGDNLISHIKGNEENEITFLMYLNGNDPLVTNENIEYVNNNMEGLFDIRIKVSQTNEEENNPEESQSDLSEE